MPEATQTADSSRWPRRALPSRPAPITFAPPAVEPTSTAPATATLSYGDKQLELKVIPATEGASGIEISKLLTTLGVITLDPGFTNTGFDHLEGHLHRRRRRDPAVPRLPDRAAGPELHLPGDQLPADPRRAAQRRPNWTRSPSGSAGTPCCTRT